MALTSWLLNPWFLLFLLVSFSIKKFNILVLQEIIFRSCETLIYRVAVKIQEGILSPGQRDRQVVASGRKLNLRRGFRWVGKRTRTFLRKYTQVAKKKHFKADYPLFYWLIIG